MITGGEDNVYEVFARFGDQQAPIRHLGSVRAGNAIHAWHVGKEAFARREDNCSLLWVTPRSSMVRSTSEDLVYLSSPSRRGYRLPGFPMKTRRKRESGKHSTQLDHDLSEANN